MVLRVRVPGTGKCGLATARKGHSMPDGERARRAWLLASALTLVLVAAPAARASTVVTVDDSSPAVEKVDSGGYKLTVGLTNITAAPVDVRLDATNQKLTKGCGVSFDSGGATGSVPAASHKDVLLSFNEACTEKDVNAVVLSAGEGAAQKVTLTPKNPQTASPDWNLLWAFAVAIGAAAVLIIVLAVIWNISPLMELVNLPDTWKFSDSLVTNVTLLGGALAGVVGSSGVVKAFLGKDADASIALATVGAAVAAAIIGLGAVVLQTFRKNGHFTAGGLLGAAAIVLGGAYGELYVVWQNAKELALGGWEHRLGWAALGVAVLLLGYAYASLKETLEQGLVPAKPAPMELSADAIAATVIASKLFGNTTPADFAKEIREAFNAEAKRHRDELAEAEQKAKPTARLAKFGITPKAVISGKSALL
jgi:hypothetical protein